MLLVASAETRPSAFHEIDDKAGSKAKLTVEYGDFSDALTKVVEALKEVRLCKNSSHPDCNNTVHVGKEIYRERESNKNARSIYQFVGC